MTTVKISTLFNTNHLSPSSNSYKFPSVPLTSTTARAFVLFSTSLFVGNVQETYIWGRKRPPKESYVHTYGLYSTLQNST
ncbi:unnamed protein product [Allacma fusca]|uniref:Uncharacterized protein n=1 Tax=Allacma fusca TaxID=39272 RepID=A0A8J2PDS1_9HEXA|nr:unnamed protein product [Allacma fusca]